MPGFHGLKTMSRGLRKIHASKKKITKITLSNASCSNAKSKSQMLPNGNSTQCFHGVIQGTGFHIVRNEVLSLVFAEQYVVPQTISPLKSSTSKDMAVNQTFGL